YVVRLRDTRHITSTDFYGAPLVVRGNPSQLWQALVALMENAIRYTPEAGRIVLRSRHQADHAILEVEDDGIGIAEEDLARIFDRFYRVDSAHSTPGFGLGLSIAKKVIEAHKGQISVQSDVGEGSLFRITLPLHSSVSKG
ncbi:MAG: sensor histidine kinase, partial [Chloroflexota bacterium]